MKTLEAAEDGWNESMLLRNSTKNIDKDPDNDMEKTNDKDLESNLIANFDTMRITEKKSDVNELTESLHSLSVSETEIKKLVCILLCNEFFYLKAL